MLHFQLKYLNHNLNQYTFSNQNHMEYFHIYIIYFLLFHSLNNDFLIDLRLNSLNLCLITYNYKN